LFKNLVKIIDYNDETNKKYINQHFRLLQHDRKENRQNIFKFFSCSQLMVAWWRQKGSDGCHPRHGRKYFAAALGGDGTRSRQSPSGF
jgi:hypothetical protein